MNRLFFAACSLLCVSSAFASFDMMLMPNLSGRVNRHDPVNNIALGGYNSNSTRMVTIDQSRNIAYGYDLSTSRVRAYNYNTGESMGVAGILSNVKSMEFSSASNRLFMMSGSELYYSPLTGPNVSFFATLGGGVSWHTMAVAGNSITVFGTTNVSTIAHETYNASTGALVNSGSLIIQMQANSPLGKAAWVQSPPGYSNSYMFSYLNSIGQTMLARAWGNNVTGAVFSVTGTSLTAFTNTNVMPAAVSGHEGFFMVGQNANVVSETLIRKYDNVPTHQLEYSHVISGSTFSSGFYQVANVVAPEPGSMIALGVGVAALLRKRRKSS